MARKYYPFFTDEDVLDATEVAPLDDVTAGTVAAGKAIIVGTNKNIDTLVIADGGLKLGSGAGTAVTATAAELNALDLTAGTGDEGKAIVLDANGKWTYGTTATPISSATASSEFFAWRTACSATTGSSYAARFQHKITGAAGSGAAIRGYGFAYGVAAASVYGGEFTGEENATGGVTGEIAGVRSVCSLQNTTPSGTAQALKLEFDVKTGVDATAITSSFITVSNGASAGTGCNTLLNIQAAKGTNSATSLSTSNHDTISADTYIRIIIDNVPHWLLATTHAPAAS